MSLIEQKQINLQVTGTQADILNLDTAARIFSGRQIDLAIITEIQNRALPQWNASYAAYGRADLGGNIGSIEYVVRNGRIYRAAVGTVPSNSDPATAGNTNWAEISGPSPGVYRGSAATFAALPAGAAGDWTLLTADDVGTGTAVAPQYPAGLYSTNGTTYSLIRALPDLYQNAIPWAANSPVRLGDLRMATIGGANVLLRSAAARITGASLGAVEYGQWNYFGQQQVPNWAASTSYPIGMQVKDPLNGNWLESLANRASRATYDATESAATNWKLLALGGAGITTFSGLQRVASVTTVLAVTATDQAYTVPVTLQTGDLLEIDHNFNNSLAESESLWVRVKAGTTQRAFPWADPTNNVHYFTFPATLTGTFQVRQATASSAPRILGVKVWRDAANGFVVPTGTTVATPYTITVNGGTNGTFTGYEGIGPEAFFLTGMGVDQEVDAFPTVAGVTLRNRQEGMFSVDRAAGGGNLALTGITFRPMNPNSVYFGTWNNQAGDSAATNGGHTCTRQLLRGTGITTANDSTFTLSGGVYRVRFGVGRHFGPNTWRNTILFVDGQQADSVYSGHDGSNWEGTGQVEWVVDATTANRSIQVQRGSSVGNGNCSGFLSIERVRPAVVPDGTVLFTARSITGTGITTTVGRDSTVSTIPITGIAAGSEISAPVATGGATVLLVDSGRGGTAYVDVVPNGADTAVSYTTSVWRRAMSATVNGSAANINGAAAVNVDATKSVAFALTLPANHRLTVAPTVTNGTLLAWSADGSGEIQPSNAGNITITATSAAITPKAVVQTTANAGVPVTLGTVRFQMTTAGNRHFQIASATGAAITAVVGVYSPSNSGAAPGGTGMPTLTLAAGGAFQSPRNYNFAGQGNSEVFMIEDQTNARRYWITCEVGAAFNNNAYMGWEL